MIQCHREHFESLCRRRGTLLESAMPCIVSQDGDIWTIDTEHEAYPQRPAQPFTPFLLGDFVERCLTRLGVTRERVERWTRTGGKPGGCGCASRKRWLNEWGTRVQGRAKRFAQMYAKAVFG